MLVRVPKWRLKIARVIGLYESHWKLQKGFGVIERLGIRGGIGFRGE